MFLPFGREGSGCPALSEKGGWRPIVMGRGEEIPPCHGMLTGLPRLAGCRDVVPEDGFTMSDDGTQCPCASYTKGGRESEEDSKSKSTRAGPPGIDRDPETSAKAQGGWLLRNGGPNEPLLH